MVLKDDDDDDEVLELKERLAAYNLESSPDHSGGNFRLAVIMAFLTHKCPSSYHKFLNYMFIS